MKTLRLFEKFISRSYTGMINRALGTTFKSCVSSVIALDNFGLPGACAWFVFMDGSTHGYAPDYLWQNRLLGDTITEELISDDHTQVIAKDSKIGFCPFRLAFELVESQRNFYECQFVGAFALSCFLRRDLTARQYVRVMNNFTIKSPGEFGKILNKKADFVSKMPQYATTIEQMGFSDKTMQLLKGHIATAGDLLELGLGANTPVTNEIRLKLYEHFSKPAPKPIIPTQPGPAPTAVANTLHNTVAEQHPVPRIFVGMAINHTLYGEGKIDKIDGKYVTVAFLSGKKQFVMPHCFTQGFLTAK